jgi:eukaryotic-like serine/threonine-protein kinase
MQPECRCQIEAGRTTVRLSGKSGSESLSAGTIVGHYVIQQQLGAGSGGVVYRSFDHRLQRAVAVKVLDPCLLGEETTWALAVSEARAAASLAHPNICTVFDVEEEDGRVFLATELVEGRSLHAAIPGHGLPYDATLRYGAQIASALAHAHDKGVCHGDVSARNVMLTFDDRVKVLDFGLAQLLSKSRSPAEPAEGARRDLQQLGILLCQMATGVFPPQALDVLVGTAPTSAILESAPILALPKRLQSIIARCMETDPAHSYQRAQQTAADLEDEFQLVRTRPVRRARSQARRYVTIAAALLFTALLAVIAFRVRNSPPPEATQITAKPLRETPANPRPAQQQDAAATSAAHHTAKPMQKPAPTTNPALQPGAMGSPNARVWANIKTKVYHCSTSGFYGKTEQGKYMTQQQAWAAGYRPSRARFCQ